MNRFLNLLRMALTEFAGTEPYIFLRSTLIEWTRQPLVGREGCPSKLQIALSAKLGQMALSIEEHLSAHD